MPELPEIEAYLHALRPRVVGSVLASGPDPELLGAQDVRPLDRKRHRRCVLMALDASENGS